MRSSIQLSVVGAESGWTGRQMDGWEGMEVAKTASLYFPSPAGVLGGPYVVQPGTL